MDNPRSVSLHIKLNTKELFLTNLEALVHRLKIFVAIYAVFLLVGLVMFVYGLFQPDQEFNDFAHQFLPPFVVLLVIPVALSVALWSAARRTVSDPRSVPGFDATISDDGVSSAGLTGQTQLKWGAYLKARETRRSLQLHVTKATFQFFPKRCFASPADIDLARQIIRDHIAKSKLYS